MLHLTPFSPGCDIFQVNGNLKWEEYEPKKWTDDDVEIKITHCGICASDLHTLRSGWGPTLYPAVVGHEIVGTAVRVGKNVQHIKEGQRVGIGAQSGSCLSCAQVSSGISWSERCFMCSLNAEQILFYRSIAIL